MTYSAITYGLPYLAFGCTVRTG